MTSTLERTRIIALTIAVSSQRRISLLAAAARLFATRGYNGAGMDEIGAAAGVSGPALYRHFGGKQDILAAVLTRLVGDLLEASAGDLERNLHRVVSVGMSRGDALAVASRQAQHLEDPARAGLDALVADLHAIWTRCVRARHRDDDDSQIMLRTRAMAGAVIGLSFAKSGPPAIRTSLAVKMIETMLEADLSPLLSRQSVGRRPGRDLTSLSGALRREALLSASAHQFAEKGFSGTSLNDIGASVGITASAVMRHFSSKEGILEAALARLADNITESIYREITNDVTPQALLSGLISNYSALAIRNSDLVVVNMTELRCLPTSYQRERRRSQRMYVDEMARAIHDTAPGLSQQESRLRAQAVYSIINEVVVERRLVAMQGLEHSLSVLAMAAARPERE
jgi:AcrR family transcriptional regulator